MQLEHGVPWNTVLAVLWAHVLGNSSGHGLMGANLGSTFTHKCRVMHLEA